MPGKRSSLRTAYSGIPVSSAIWGEGYSLLLVQAHHELIEPLAFGGAAGQAPSRVTGLDRDPGIVEQPGDALPVDAGDRGDLVGGQHLAGAETTGPLVPYYAERGILVTVNANQPPDAVTAEIMDRLAALGVRALRKPTKRTKAAADIIVTGSGDGLRWGRCRCPPWS